MTVTLPDHDEQQATAEQLLAATLSLQTAVDQLVQPSTERLDRSRPETDPDAAADVAHDAAQLEEDRKRDGRILVQLHQRHADARRRHDGAAMRRVMRELLEHGERVRHATEQRALQAAARAAAIAELPSLIDQLRDAVESGTRGSGVTPRSVHRLPIDPTAAELLAHIERTVGHRDGSLSDAVRAWSGAILEEANATTLPDAAAYAEQWVKRAREIVAPADIEEITTDPCPICGNLWVHLPDDSGQIVRKAALQRTRGKPTATGQVEGDEIRCIWRGCAARWPQTHYDHFGRLLAQKRRERDEEKHRRGKAS